MGLRQGFWSRLFGEPRGAFGWVGARVMGSAMKQYTRAMAAELRLQPDDELLDVGCGSGRLHAEHAADVRFVAGLDISEITLRVYEGKSHEGTWWIPRSCGDVLDFVDSPST